MYASIGLVLIGFWLFLHYWYKRKTKRFIQAFLDSQNNITILTTLDEVTIVNKVGLSVLGFNSLKSFLDEKPTLLDFFMEEENCLDKYTHGRKWIEVIEQSKKKNVKVKIRSRADSLECYYQIKISKLINSKEYILTFMDISDIERDQKTLKQTAELDPLTKIYNRVKLNKIFENIFLQANKHSFKLSVILFDIDHFKMINDTYGHNVGDKVLVELSRLSQGILREKDVLARWGGEEFMIVLSNTSVEEAKGLANRLRIEIDKYPFEVVKHVTCSFGVTEFSAGDTQFDFLERVDEALYEAKDAGRNKVIMKRKP